MKKTEFDDSRMLDATLGIFAEDPGIAAGKPVLLKVVTDLKVVRSMLHTAIHSQLSLTKGLSQDKVIKSSNLVTKAMNVCTAGLDYAFETENAHLEAIMDVNETDLSELPQPGLVSACEVIYTAASAVGAELVSYGLSPFDLDDFQNEIIVFKTALEHALVALAGRISATSEIPALLRRAKKIMKKRLDRQMKQFRKSNPGLHKKYIAARKVRHHGVRHEKPVDGAGGDVVVA